MRAHLLPLLFAPLLFSGCVSVPDGIKPVSDFDAERYLGTWYEIARLDHSFERGLEQVSANYTLRDDGSIRVLNNGRKAETGEWKTAEGRARLVGAPDTAHLKVSFFGPFYASYVVFSLDPEYSVSYVTGYNRNYLWLLARKPMISPAEKQRFLATITELGFETDSLIWVNHQSAN